MATTVTMPQLGETVTEGTILSWVKAVGDSIEIDEVLVEISTDKVDTEIPSPVSGVILEILAQEGDTIEISGAMAKIASDSASTSASQPSPASAPAPAPASEPSTASIPVPGPTRMAVADVSSGVALPVSEGAFFSPVVRKLAKENNVDLVSVTGTGKGGRITRKDIDTYISENKGKLKAPAPVSATESDVAASTAPSVTEPALSVAASAHAPAPVSDVPTMPGDQVVDLDRLRERIGANIIRAKEVAAHVWTSIEIDFEKVERVRQAHKAAFKAAEGYSLTYLPFIARATVDALKEYPVVNSSFYLEEKKAVFHSAVNLGIAIDLNQTGLVVATMKDADSLQMVGMARSIRALADKARAGKLDPNDILGSTFTITNPGPFGSFMSAPIINLPNVGILSTDTVAKRPVVTTTPDGQDIIAIRHIGYLGLTWDHRAFDGSTALLFLKRIKENLESWDWEQELA
jgi:pyruvate dehydrogenase E2 component (dihydrolipoamide acetyltransferase)